MAEKTIKNWYIDVPWGRLAMVSWGERAEVPVLLVHGYMDSAATFTPLVDLLPNNYYYVSFDLPGHGYSDTPPGSMINQLHLVEAIARIVQQMQWETFICIAHSMGYLLSLFYNAAYPGKMSKIVSLDGNVSIGPYMLTYSMDVWMKFVYDGYYKENGSQESKTYTYEEAISLMVRARQLSEPQAALLLSRCLERVGPERYRLRWDHRLKKMANVLLPSKMLYNILVANIPVLAIVASEDNSNVLIKEHSKQVFDKLKSLPNYSTVNVEGGHSIHFSNPESFYEHIVKFMRNDASVTSKL